MAIGDPFVNDVAPVGSIGPGYATATNALLTEMRDRLEEEIPFSALAGDELDMENSPIVRIQYAQFEPQVSLPATSPAGRIEYYGGDWYLVNDTGAIKVTEGAGLNFAAAGAIGGDYGGTNPALLQFVDSSKYYEFYDDFAGLAWAYTRMRGVDIAGGLTSIAYAQLRYAGTTSKVFTFPDHHAASGEKGLLQIDDAGDIEVNGTTRPLTHDIYLDGAAKVRHGTRTMLFTPSTQNAWTSLMAINPSNPSLWGKSFNNTALTCSATATFRVTLPPFKKGIRITGMTCKGHKLSASSMTFGFYSVTVGASAVEARTLIGSTWSTSTNGAYTATQSFTRTIATGEAFLFEWIPPTGGDSLYSIEISYDIVA